MIGIGEASCGPVEQCFVKNFVWIAWHVGFHSSILFEEKLELLVNDLGFVLWFGVYLGIIFECSGT